MSTPEESAVDEGFFKKTLRDGQEYLQVTFRGGTDNEGKRKGFPLRVKGHGMYGTQFNNAPRTFQGKKVNDLLMLLKALGHTETPKTNLQYIQALLQYAGRSFRAKQTLTATAKLADHGFDAKYASWVYDKNKRNGDAVETPHTSAQGKQTLPLIPGEDGKFVEDLQITNESTGEVKNLRVFGNLSDFSSAGNGAA